MEEATKKHIHEHDKDHCCSCCESEHEEVRKHDHGCGCGCSCADAHGHEHEEGELRSNIIKIAISVILAIAALTIIKLAPIETAWICALIFLPSFIVIGISPLIEAVHNISEGEIFDENLLMIIASVGAFVLGEYVEGLAVMILFQIGEILQSLGIARSRKSIGSLMDLKPDKALKEVTCADGTYEYEETDPEKICIGDILLVKPGEKIPLDGIVTDGESTVDTSALTGESLPMDINPGSEVVSGSIVQNKPIKIKVTKEYKDSTVARILYLVENASERKSKSENFITKFARIYTPAVVLCALVLAVVPPLISGGSAGVWADWIHRALTFLVISCPCALVISVPLSFYVGIGTASKYGILIKGSQYVDTLAKAGTAVFDKTGTLTKGSFEVTDIHTEEGFTQEELLYMTACAENYSNHPIARSIAEHYFKLTGNKADESAASDFEELTGRGIKAIVQGKTLLAGNASISDAISGKMSSSGAAVNIYVVIDGKYAGYFTVSDAIRPETKDGIAALKNIGVQRTVMLTGDSENAANEIARQAEIDEVHAGCLPQDKVAHMEKIKKETADNGSLIFAGDGINDAPVLACADIGIAMGGIGSDAAIEAADIVIMKDDIRAISKAIHIAKKTVLTAKGNIAFSIAVKLAILALSAFGIGNMWIAVFADVGVCMLAIFNAMLISRRVKS